MSNIFEKWRDSLTKTRDITFGKIASYFGATEINTETWDRLEELLIQADIGVNTTLQLLDVCQEAVDKNGYTKTAQLRELMIGEMRQLLIQAEEPQFPHQPTVIMLTGVNGSGKTTTIGKLAWRYKKMGKSVLLVAADTFRAAASEQLEVWAKRVDVPIVTAPADSDPGAVTFDGIQSAVAKKIDIVLVDTAGRLHTRYNLMEEIKKVYRVAGKALPGAPHYSWIVLDSTTGQNALQQARAFSQAVQLNGAILAKLDSSAKGGMVFAIKDELKLPIIYAGLGEKIDDLQLFDRESFIEGLFSEERLA